MFEGAVTFYSASMLPNQQVELIVCVADLTIGASLDHLIIFRAVQLFGNYSELKSKLQTENRAELEP